MWGHLSPPPPPAKSKIRNYRFAASCSRILRASGKLYLVFGNFAVVHIFSESESSGRPSLKRECGSGIYSAMKPTRMRTLNIHGSEIRAGALYSSTNSPCVASSIRRANFCSAYITEHTIVKNNDRVVGVHAQVISKSWLY